MSEPLPFDVAVVIGRFQPFHLGHAALLAKALTSASRVLVVLGSSRHARSAKNPFSWQERAAMISASVDAPTSGRLRFVPMRDYYDHQHWAEAVNEALRDHTKSGDRIVLVGHVKDASSYYLKLFPAWAYLAAGLQGDYNATAIRHLFFAKDANSGASDASNASNAQLTNLLPSAVHHYLLDWKKTTAFTQMQQEHLAIEESKKTWGTGPFITLDALVTTANHVLLVRRGRCPGKGLWAIPGGFLEPDERLLDGATRELCEETTLDLHDPVHQWTLKQVAVFDHPDRSQRGRIITHVHHFDLGDVSMPQVKGADDADEAQWLPIQALGQMEEQFFEDHFHVLNHFFSMYP